MAILKNLVVLGNTQCIDVMYAPNIYEGGIQLSSKYASISHTHTKSEVGLGNVDNTADANKSVNYATSAGSAGSVSRATFGDSSNGSHDCNAIASNGLWYYSSNGPATSLGASTTDGALYSQAYSTSWVGQIAQDYRNGRLFIRGRNSGTWTSWLRIWDTGTFPVPTTSDSGKLIQVNSSGAYALVTIPNAENIYY